MQLELIMIDELKAIGEAFSASNVRRSTRQIVRGMTFEYKAALYFALARLNQDDGWAWARPPLRD